MNTHSKRCHATGWWLVWLAVFLAVVVGISSVARGGTSRSTTIAVSSFDETVSIDGGGSARWKSALGGLWFRIGRKADNRVIAAVGTDRDHYVAIDYGKGRIAPSTGGNRRRVQWQQNAATQMRFAVRHGRLKFSIRLAAKPARNSWPFRFMLRGVSRSGREFYVTDDVGKVPIFEIERPFARDAAGRRVWCSYAGGKLAVPQKFLDTATYPVIVDPTIASINTATVSGWAGGRVTGYANGYRWCAVYDGDDAVMYSSPDGTTWTARGDINYDSANVGNERAFAIDFDAANNAAYCIFTAPSNYHDYSKLNLGSDGTVTSRWPATSDNVAGVAAGNAGLNFDIARDSQGNVWWTGLYFPYGGAPITFEAQTGTEPASTWWPRTPANHTTSQGSYSAQFLHQGVDAGDMVVCQTLVAGATKQILTNYWDQSAGAYDGWVVALTDLYGSLSIYYRVGTVQTDDGKIHIIYSDGSYGSPWYGLSHRVGSAAQPVVWSQGGSDITDDKESLYPAVCTDGTDIWVFFVEYNGATTTWLDVIYYVKWTASLGTWGEPVEFYDASGDTMSTRAIGCWKHSGDDAIGVIWTTGASSPYSTQYLELNIGSPSTGIIPLIQYRRRSYLR